MAVPTVAAPPSGGTLKERGRFTPGGYARRSRSGGFWMDAVRRLQRDRITVIALGLLAMLTLVAVSADLLADHFFHTGFAEQDLLYAYDPPTGDVAAYWLGADNLGRSEIVRLLYGTRVSLFIGVFGAAQALILGLSLGMTSGYFRGRWDSFVVWLVTTLDSIPIIFLLILVGVYFRLSPLSLALLIGSFGWINACNVSRGQTFALREREYVLAARTIGASSWRIIFSHVLPNVLPLMVVVAMFSVGGTMLAEAALSFLGFGIQPPVPSWGNMLSGATQFYYKAPHLIIFPGLAISLSVLCVYLIGDGLRDALDPRLGILSGRRRG